MQYIRILASVTFLEGVRNRFLYGLLVIAVLLFGANMAITHSFAYDLGKVAVDMGLSANSFFGLIIIFFLGINLISKDLDKLTIYMVLARPISRWQYVFGKFIGLSLILLVSLAILGIISAGSVLISTVGKTAYIPINFSWSIFFVALVYQFLSLNLIMAVTFFFAVSTSSAFVALLLSMSVYFLGQNIELVLKLISSAPYFEYTEQLKAITEALSWVFPNLAAFDLKTSAAYGLSLDPVYLAWTMGYGLVYTGLLLFFTSIIFNRRELA